MKKKKTERPILIFILGRSEKGKQTFFLGLIEHTSSMKGIVLAHHTLTCDWNNFSMATFLDLKGAQCDFFQLFLKLSEILVSKDSSNLVRALLLFGQPTIISLFVYIIMCFGEYTETETIFLSLTKRCSFGKICD